MASLMVVLLVVAWAEVMDLRKDLRSVEEMAMIQVSQKVLMLAVR